MAIGDVIRKKIPKTGDGKKIREITGADTFGDFAMMTLGKKPFGGTMSKPQTVNVTVPKSKPVKYASIGKKQMRIGRSGTIITSGGLLTNNNTTIKKKTLLGE